MALDKNLFIRKGRIILSCCIAIFVFLESFSGIAAFAKEEQKVNNIANDLEFIMEEAVITKNGVETLDFNKLESYFGERTTNEIKSLTINYTEDSALLHKNFVTQVSKGTFKSCMIGALKDYFGVALVEAALTGGLWGYLKKKAYKEAAKLLVKIGVGTNAAT